METSETPVSNSDSLRRAEIDRSVKAPVLFFFTNAAMWLLASTVLGLIASVKIFYPQFLDYDWLWFLNYGRLQPVHMATLVYGWAMQAGLGTALWLIARRSLVPLAGGQGSMIVAGIFWNIGVTIGVFGVILGGSTSLQWLEFPVFVWPLLLVSYLIIAWKMVAHYILAQKKDGYQLVSRYVMVGLFAFPWLFLTANLFLNHYANSTPLGAFGAGINAWYVSSLILLFFTPIGVAASYYFIPKITGKPVYSFQLAQFGFWGLIVLGGWTGFNKYMAGPLPAWMPGVSGMAWVLLLVPAGVLALNNHMTTLGKHGLIESSPTLRFVFVGSFSYLIMAAIGALLGTFWGGSTMQFTHAEYGFHLLAIYGFFSMTMFGAIYYIVPRLTGCEWLSVRLIRNHFWFSVYGITALVVCMIVGGLAQGASTNSPDNWNQPFIGSITNARGYLIGRALAWAFILWSNTWFFIHLVLMVMGLGRRTSTPTLLVHDSHHDYVPGTIMSATTTEIEA
ncbi:hypothetical protein FEM03_13655 [Phragmitibacter flavus]|uniref:Cytochrome oxidase subunit I profile domain-containing protein n=1 Tax=Phragmitibacter flavus TaxID=2576071 RepID=A0A5R8KDA9_9BACT|nr:cbb3-type cytochrome c oxidase subunit I [Phragmitibacter flavus]TLD70227.1 hypothetical protein FEM03_13655 [Phragmitibacter flavus]